MDADFTGGVAAEHGAGVDEPYLRAMARGGNRRTEAGHAAADHDDVITNFLVTFSHDCSGCLYLLK